jgi:hypothetical protein
MTEHAILSHQATTFAPSLQFGVRRREGGRERLVTVGDDGGVVEVKTRFGKDPEVSV